LDFGSVIDEIACYVPHVREDDSKLLKKLNISEKETILFIPYRLFETFEYPELGN